MLRKLIVSSYKVAGFVILLGILTGLASYVVMTLFYYGSSSWMAPVILSPGDRRVLEEHYDGYRFSEDAPERIFNSDMVLYFLRELNKRGRFPRQMLDRNVRTEYGHLRRIGALSGADAALRRSLLQQILSEGRIRSQIVEQFGVRSLASQAHFLSLLYFLGMLTIGASPRDPLGYDLAIPNRVIRELQWEHLALMLEEEALVTVQVDELRAALEPYPGVPELWWALSARTPDPEEARRARDRAALLEPELADEAAARAAWDRLGLAFTSTLTLAMHAEPPGGALSLDALFAELARHAEP